MFTDPSCETPCREENARVLGSFKEGRLFRLWWIVLFLCQWLYDSAAMAAHDSCYRRSDAIKSTPKQPIMRKSVVCTLEIQKAFANYIERAENYPTKCPMESQDNIY